MRNKNNSNTYYIGMRSIYIKGLADSVFLVLTFRIGFETGSSLFGKSQKQVFWFFWDMVVFSYVGLNL